MLKKPEPNNLPTRIKGGVKTIVVERKRQKCGGGGGDDEGGEKTIDMWWSQLYIVSLFTKLC